MGRFNLSADLNQSIVDGILMGYKSYLAARRQAKEELKVSTAYSWVKGNHIDSCVDEMCSTIDNVDSSIEKAGYTWEYIQFHLTCTHEKYLIIVKNSRGIEQTFNGKPDTISPENYLFEYAGINNPLISSGELKAIQQPKAVQLELSLPEIEAIRNNVSLSAPAGFNRFYVVTYEIDNLSKMISSIKLTMPNQQEMILVEVDDLTALINNSGIFISEEELKTVQMDKIPEEIFASDNQLFGYGVAEDELQKDNEELNNEQQASE